MKDMKYVEKHRQNVKYLIFEYLKTDRQIYQYHI